MSYALVTVTDSSFLVGTEVMLHSFLEHDPWFDGDFVVIHDGLPDDARARLEALHPTTFLDVSDELREKVADLYDAIPKLSGITARFFKLELFRLTGYDRLVFLDSDLFCVGSIREIFERTEGFLCCPDSCFYRNALRDYISYEQVQESFARSYGEKLYDSFNSGVLSIGGEHLRAEVHRDLVAMIDRDTWRKIAVPRLADQIILNYYFRGRQTLMSGKYNFVVFLEQLIRSKEGIRFFDARVIHFAGKLKPWYVFDLAELAAVAPGYIKYIDLWRDAHRTLAASRNGSGAEQEKIDEHLEWLRRFNQHEFKLAELGEP